MKIGPFARGIATYVPGISRLQQLNMRTGGTDSGRYCYSVWLRHLAMAFRHGRCVQPPRRVAELGPGDSIGIGLAALLSGADRYFGLDAVPLAPFTRNLAVFDELVDLFRSCTPVPDDSELPSVRPKLDSYEFPPAIAVPDDARIERIRRSSCDPTCSESMIRYVAPWWSPEVIERGGVDMIFSQAALEHVDDLTAAYAAMRAWLAPHGWLSHQVDFRCHGTAREWNGHWTYGDRAWRMIRGRRSFLINREPHSAHVKLMRESGFEVTWEQLAHGAPLERRRLAPRFAHLTDADLSTSGAYVQARLAPEVRLHGQHRGGWHGTASLEDS